MVERRERISKKKKYDKNKDYPSIQSMSIYFKKYTVYSRKTSERNNQA